eukprot:TRINITY_DN21446_c0_g1_i1.p1 TRINITY_DN21446_c0_g1~~TRINITY_DN21446_c0_g1_i1.p1  ORF type:complete len:564 (+),score=75.22 TRINITY_DN21446_c0_g1_i1:56-1693(+)
MSDVTESRAELIAKIFTMFDRNRDGKVSLDEMTSVMMALGWDRRKTSTLVTSIFSECSGEDNMIDLSEWSAWLFGAADTHIMRATLGLDGAFTCANGCGRTPFKHHRTCCTWCQRSDGTSHHRDCDKRHPWLKCPPCTTYIEAEEAADMPSPEKQSSAPVGPAPDADRLEKVAALMEENREYIDSGNTFERNRESWNHRIRWPEVEMKLLEKAKLRYEGRLRYPAGWQVPPPSYGSDNSQEWSLALHIDAMDDIKGGFVWGCQWSQTSRMPGTPREMVLTRDVNKKPISQSIWLMTLMAGDPIRFWVDGTEYNEVVDTLPGGTCAAFRSTKDLKSHCWDKFEAGPGDDTSPKRSAGWWAARVDTSIHLKIEKPTPLPAPPGCADVSVLRRMLGEQLIRTDGSTVDTAQALGSCGPVIGIFFTTATCGCCNMRYPSLKTFYQKVNATEKRLEIVHITEDNGADDDEAAFLGRDHPWLAVPFGSTYPGGFMAMRFYWRFSWPRIQWVSRDGIPVGATKGGCCPLLMEDYDRWVAYAEQGGPPEPLED